MATIGQTQEPVTSDELDETISDLLAELEDNGLSADAAYAALTEYLGNVPINAILNDYERQRQ